MLALVAIVASVVVRFGPPWLRRFSATASRVMLLALGAILAAYPSMLQSSLAFPVNIFQTDVGSAEVFFHDFVGWRNLWPAATAVFAGIVAPRLGFLRLRQDAPSPRLHCW